MKKYLNRLIGLIVCLNMGYNVLLAQDVKDLNTCIATALENNLMLKSARLEYKMQEALKGTAYDLPKTDFNFQYGNVNNANVDYSLNVVQAFASPVLYSKQNQLNEKKVISAEKRIYVEENRLVRAVKLAYYQLVFLHNKKELLQEQDTLYQNLLHTAEVRFKTGETGILEKLNFESQYKDIQNKLRVIEVDIYTQEKELDKLLNVPEQVKILPEKLKRLELGGSLPSVEGNPELDYLSYQISLIEQQTSVLKAKNKPDFRLGYYNMQESFNPNLHVVQAGISIPFFNKAQKSQINASVIAKEMASNGLAYQEQIFQQNLQTLGEQLIQFNKSLEYYESFALPQALLILQNAEKSYTTGEINYIAFMQNKTLVYQIRQGYLDELLNYNKIIIEIQTIAGQQ